LKGFFPAIGCALAILFLSSKAGIDLPESWMDFIAMDKLGHAVVYGALTYLLLRGFKKEDRTGFAGNTAVSALIISIVYGISMELMQYLFFPGRFFEVYDIIANIIGSIIGRYIFKYFNNS